MNTFNSYNMPILLVVEKNGSIKEISVKDFNEDELYKKAGFKTKDGFGPQIHWAQKNGDTPCMVSLYGKTKGRAGMENKYDFPPPIDTVLYFGSCILLNRNEKSQLFDLTKIEWLKIYEKLFGGFEDLGLEDSDEEEEEDDGAPRTKEGYVKDDFVVDEEEEEEEEEDDDEETELIENDEETITEDDIEDELDDDHEEDDEEEEEEDDEEEEEIPSKKKILPKKKQETKRRTPIVEKIAKITKKPVEKNKRSQDGLARTESNNYLNCSNELTEEDYV